MSCGTLCIVGSFSGELCEVLEPEVKGEGGGVSDSGAGE